MDYYVEYSDNDLQRVSANDAEEATLFAYYFQGPEDTAEVVAVYPVQ